MQTWLAAADWLTVATRAAIQSRMVFASLLLLLDRWGRLEGLILQGRMNATPCHT